MKFKEVMRDERGFVHKRFISAAKGFITGGFNPLSALSGFLTGGGGGDFANRQAAATAAAAARQQPTFQIPAPSVVRIASPLSMGIAPRGGGHAGTAAMRAQMLSVPDIVQEGFDLITGGNGPIPGGRFSTNGCNPPNVLVGDICTPPGSPAGPAGQAILGRFGAALEPTFQTFNKRVCLPGMVLGKPEMGGLPLCYNVGAISNKQRLWPRGTAPLLTGGEMACIRKAATAKGKVERTAKRLGILKAAPRRKTGPSRPRALVKVLESGPGSVQL